MKRTPIERYEDAIYRFTAWRRWRHATSYLDMCRINADELTARRDKGLSEIAPVPVIDMLTAQIQLNQAGMLTYYAHPGIVKRRGNLTPIEHRAVVLLILDDKKKDWLADQLWKSGHLEHSKARSSDPADAYHLTARQLHDPENRTKNGPIGPAARHGFIVARTGDVTISRAGEQMTAAQIHDMFPVRPDAAAQLYRGWQVGISASTFGDSNLFATLIDICDLRTARPQISRLTMDDVLPIND